MRKIRTIRIKMKNLISRLLLQVRELEVEEENIELLEREFRRDYGGKRLARSCICRRTSEVRKESNKEKTWSNTSKSIQSSQEKLQENKDSNESRSNRERFEHKRTTSKNMSTRTTEKRTGYIVRVQENTERTIYLLVSDRTWNENKDVTQNKSETEMSHSSLLYFSQNFEVCDEMDSKENDVEAHTSQQFWICSRCNGVNEFNEVWIGDFDTKSGTFSERRTIKNICRTCHWTKENVEKRFKKCHVKTVKEMTADEKRKTTKVEYVWEV